MKILIADEHPLARMVLKRILQGAYPNLELEEADNEGILLKKAMKQKWDLIISDLFSPMHASLYVLRQLKKKVPNVPVLTFTMFPAEEYALSCLASGSSGYLTRESVSWELIKAVKAILSGKKYLPLVVSDMLELGYENNLRDSKYKISMDWYFQLPKMLAEGNALPNLQYKFS